MKAVSIGPPQYVETYPTLATCLPKVRKQVDLTLRIWGMEHLLDEASLIATELVTNTIQHSPCKDVTVSIVRLRDGIRLCVTDSCKRPPKERCPGEDEEGGRGVLLVKTLSSRWGVTPLPSGKTVWADLSRKVL